jgi:hypothetical protein
VSGLLSHRGTDHAYFLEAPKARVMDSGDAAKEKIGAVFHPANAHWPKSGVIISALPLYEALASNSTNQLYSRVG